MDCDALQQLRVIQLRASQGRSKGERGEDCTKVCLRVTVKINLMSLFNFSVCVLL